MNLLGKTILSTAICINAIQFGYGEVITPESPDSGFGYKVQLAEDIALIRGGWGWQGEENTVAIYKNIENGHATKTLTLVASDLSGQAYFGDSIEIYGNTAYIGASTDNGGVYVYRNLDTRTQTTEDLKLVSSNPNAGLFGCSISIDKDIAAICARGMGNASGKDGFYGAVYIYKGINGRTQTTEDLELVATGLGEYDAFGSTVSLKNDTALVGAWDSKKAYVYRNISTRTKTTQDLELTSSNAYYLSRSELGGFGNALAIMEDNTALLGASSYLQNAADGAFGAVLVYRNIDTRTKSTEDFVLRPYERTDNFGCGISLSGENAIIGASDCAYLYMEIESKLNENTYEDVVIYRPGGIFMSSIGFDGDTFILPGREAAYTGSIMSITTLDKGSASKTIDGISFSSRRDWIIGENTSSNKVTLAGKDSYARIYVDGKAVYIGKNTASDGNTLVIEGELSTKNVYVGSVDGNIGNSLVFAKTANLENLGNILLSEGTFIMFESDWSDESDLFKFLGTTNLMVWDELKRQWIGMDESNYLDWLAISKTDSGGMLVAYGAIPEPAALAAIFGALALAIAAYRRKK